MTDNNQSHWQPCLQMQDAPHLLDYNYTPTNI